ncbi:similar to Saccharomyces cerevisiae YBR182C SMP1 Putative transcription factor involved in regulating the response to osmotic stress [Maudiozyma saulgeensis]|uniref:Similar to Saccharomyces cerevisiae YBR182C SMP1 Putative transcription factor involved in regulating the response to osmotic stress n=1 Tax=Maudiozyma saulgeensis TaxID=1789683 RepID=A0A1X7R6H1_9SACH|nr:similar to Saccharomyces cerevisiae YBR182C SMP1 Putative transcription factor involved in regulating the response to osmotic stress [Kazachstania saulgeensis]
MGRRKIEIQPLTDERNRTVTFIKRKAGLLKKAHELAVLCQVDVTLLIIGPNNTLYEFSSVDTTDLIDHYLNDKTMIREIKGPEDFGNYKKNKNVYQENLVSDSGLIEEQISKKRRLSMINNNNSTYLSQNDSDDSDSNDNISSNTISNNSTSHTRNSSLGRNKGNTRTSNHQNARSNDTSYLSTSFQESSDRDLKHHLQNQIKGYGILSNTGHQMIRQPGNDQQHLSNNDPLNDEISSNKPDGNMIGTPSINTQQNITSGSGSTHSSVSHNDTHEQNKKTGARPVLRVEIPNNNVISNNAIQSEPSSSTVSVTTANIYGSNGSSQYFKKLNNDGKGLANITTKMESPVSGTGNALSLDKGNDSSKVPLKAPNSTTFSFSNGLPPLFSSTSAVPPYVATPLQGSNNGNNNSNSNNNNNNNNPMNFSGNNSSSPIQAQILPIQKQLPSNQTQRYNQQIPFNPPQLGSARIFSPTGGLGNVTKMGVQDHMMNGPPTGSLPSKFANELMMPSPNGSISMFQDWSLGSGNNANGANGQNSSTLGGNNMANNTGGISGTNNANNGNPFPTSSNGNTGLTPYLNAGQTPLANRFFNFAGDVVNDDSGANNSIKNLKKEE